MTNVAALFVDPLGVYPELVSPGFWWDEIRDARTYNGTDPVVAHPPCRLWVNMAAVNYTRATAPCERCGGEQEYFAESFGRCRSCNGTGRREPNRAIVKPAWYPGGDDGGCFASALANVRRCGGVLEHPAGSHAWAHHLLGCPMLRGAKRWHESGPNLIEQPASALGEWQCEVWQSAYGHAARKRTWLLYCGRRPPFEFDWAREPGTHQVGWFDRNKPTLGKRQASATPSAFAAELIRLAEFSRGC